MFPQLQEDGPLGSEAGPQGVDELAGIVDVGGAHVDEETQCGRRGELLARVDQGQAVTVHVDVVGQGLARQRPLELGQTLGGVGDGVDDGGARKDPGVEGGGRVSCARTPNIRDDTLPAFERKLAQPSCIRTKPHHSGNEMARPWR